MRLFYRFGIVVFLSLNLISSGCSPSENPPLSNAPTSSSAPATPSDPATPSAPATPSSLTPEVTEPAPRSLSLLVPAYFGSEHFDESFQTIFQQVDPRVSVHLIINPASGPGVSAEERYTQASILPLAHQKGCKLLGYVYCSTSVNNRWVLRPETEVFDEIDRWIDFYHQAEHPLSGFFFDLMPSDPEQAAAFARITQHARESLDGALIVANPGTTFDLEYQKQNAADVYLCTETFRFTPLTLPQVPAWAASLETPQRFAAMAKDVDRADWKWMFEGKVLADFSMVYLTDMSDSGEYQNVASFYSELVEAIALYNGDSLKEYP